MVARNPLCDFCPSVEAQEKTPPEELVR